MLHLVCKMVLFNIFHPHGRKSSVITRYFPCVRTEIYKHILAIFHPHGWKFTFIFDYFHLDYSLLYSRWCLSSKLKCNVNQNQQLNNAKTNRNCSTNPRYFPSLRMAIYKHEPKSRVATQMCSNADFRVSYIYLCLGRAKIGRSAILARFGLSA